MSRDITDVMTQIIDEIYDKHKRTTSDLRSENQYYRNHVGLLITYAEKQTDVRVRKDDPFELGKAAAYADMRNKLARVDLRK